MDMARIRLAEYTLTHRHGDGEVAPMREHHSPAEHDAERWWARGARIFRCDCGEEVAVTVEDDPESARPSAS